MKAQNTSFHDGGGGEERGKLFFRKVSPRITKKHLQKQMLFLARRKGFEPPTFWFVAKHSIQLS